MNKVSYGHLVASGAHVVYYRVMVGTCFNGRMAVWAYRGMVDAVSFHGGQSNVCVKIHLDEFKVLAGGYLRFVAFCGIDVPRLPINSSNVLSL